MTPPNRKAWNPMGSNNGRRIKLLGEEEQPQSTQLNVAAPVSNAHMVMLGALLLQGRRPDAPLNELMQESLGYLGHAVFLQEVGLINATIQQAKEAAASELARVASQAPHVDETPGQSGSSDGEA